MSFKALQGRQNEAAKFIRRIQKYILANLHDPQLDADSIARAHNITTRTPHRLFSADGSTPIRWV
jgi:hypothetical protein